MIKTFLHLIIILHAFPLLLNAQEKVTLSTCYGNAVRNHSLSADKEVYEELWQKKDVNLEKGWLPSFDLNASFLYNSEVIDMSSAFASIPIPGIAENIKSMPNEQYKMTLDISQLIYDGGAIKSSRDLEKATLAVNEQLTEAEIYKIKAQVNSCFFNIFLLRKQGELLNNYLAEINSRLNMINSAVRNGAATSTDADVFVSEKLRLEQQINENSIRRSSLLSILSDITGVEITDDESLLYPEISNSLPVELGRPELKVLDLTKAQLGAGKMLLQSKRMPKASGFATMGYGNPPGNNFFKDSFSPYYIVGAALKWNIYDWNRVKNEKQVMTLQEELIDSRKKDLSLTLQRQLDAKSAEIAALRSLIEKDPELITLRKRISLASLSQYENGTITAIEYLTQVNNEKQAMINGELHRIALTMATAEYYNICGQEIE